LIPQANITAWRTFVPWVDDAQVEQDLVLSRAIVELFVDSNLTGKVALRGGTSLHKLFLRPPRRYSEDIDLVQPQAEPIGSVIDAIRANLDPWLGRARRQRGPASVTLTYRFESEIAPVRPLRLKIEINTREHFALLGLKPTTFAVNNPWFSGTCEIATFDIDELLATKLRALYQRRKGRDLFDLWLCIEHKLIKPQRLVDCFVEYMEREGHPLTRFQFEQNLQEKKADPAFLSDIGPLLRPGLSYDAAIAIDVVRNTLIELLPGEQKRGARSKNTPSTRRRKKR
jgi:predicted nucleotidyltransferase component of viral defense system